MRLLAGVLAVAVIVGFGWVFSLPDKADCVASGRVVDPTGRHCQDASGYQQLQEHALFHGRDVALGVGVVVAASYAIYRVRRRRSTGAAPTA